MQFLNPPAIFYISFFAFDDFGKLVTAKRSSFITTKHVLPVMKPQRSGRIINMASINGLVGFAGKAAYYSAKHGIIGLTKVTALEVPGITLRQMLFVPAMLIPNWSAINYLHWQKPGIFQLIKFWMKLFIRWFLKRDYSQWTK